MICSTFYTFSNKNKEKRKVENQLVPDIYNLKVNYEQNGEPSLDGVRL